MKTYRHILIVSALCLLPLCLYAEAVPEGYYTNADGKKDAELKTALSQICRGGTRYEYGTNQYHSTDDPDGQWKKGDFKAYGTWQALPQTDMHPDGIVWDMYSDCVRYYPNKPGDSGCSLNIEHCLPKSWWGGAVNEAYKDLYNLNPSDQRANGQKSNYAPGHIEDGKADKFDNGSFRMASAKNSGYGYICWEPAEEYRGDFARTYFYMATAYEYLEWTAYPDYISKESYLMFSDKIQQVLRKWHQDDPVSDKEICRADRISDIQGNRNPFIDYPDLVDYIWGDKKGQEVDFSTLTCTYKANACPAPVIPTPDSQKYDTLINLPAITAALVNAVKGNITGSANSGIQSNGNSSITMGKSSTDGEISFTGINLTDTAVLAFRASPYNSATSMQLDIYAGDNLVKSITETVVKETRNEVRYRVTIPKGTTSIRLVSVGGSTSKRACIQELYLLKPLPQEPTVVAAVAEGVHEAARKFLRDGNLYISIDGKTYSILGLQ